MEMEVLRYPGWIFYPEIGTAFHEGTQTVMRFRPSPNPPPQYEAKVWYNPFLPEKVIDWEEATFPFFDGKVDVFTGGCLFDGALLFIFKQIEKKGLTTPAPRSPVIPSHLRELERKIDQQGYSIAQIVAPVEPGLYHYLLALYQAESVRKILNLVGISRVIYHVPRREYHEYIEEWKRWIGEEAAKVLHEILDGVADQFIDIIRSKFPRNVEIVFADPYEFGAKNPQESYAWLYYRPQAWGAHPQRRWAVEDATEWKTVCAGVELAMQAGDFVPPFPVWLGMLGPPHPYFRNDPGGRKVRIIDVKKQ